MWKSKPEEEEEEEAVALISRLSLMESRYERAQKQVVVPGIITKEEAFNYLQTVKTAFHYKKDKYNQFVSTLHAFYLRRIDIETLIKRMKVLLEGHAELVLGFQKFLPAGYKITCEDYRKKITIEDALYFVSKMKVYLSEESKEYQNLYGIMVCYKNNEMSPRDVYYEAERLFEGHPDLLQEFNKFIPW